jgi:hypothetical protein
MTQHYCRVQRLPCFLRKCTGIHRNIGVQKDSETLLLNTVFNILCPCLRIWLLKFKKILIGPKHFLLAKFELGNRKYAEFHADSEIRNRYEKCDKLANKKVTDQNS